MSPERWEKLIGELKDKFPLVEEGKGEFDDMPGSFEFVVFDGPMGRIKLEFVERPVILDKKTTTSRRIGADVGVQYIYSDTETTHKMTVYKWNDGTGEWEEMKANMFE